MLSIGKILKGYWSNNTKQQDSNYCMVMDKRYKKYVVIDNITENILKEFNKKENAEIFIRNRNARIIDRDSNEMIRWLLQQNLKQSKDSEPYILSKTLEEQLEL